MKRISYTTTMALLLASSILTTPVAYSMTPDKKSEDATSLVDTVQTQRIVAMQSQQLPLSLDQQLVSDIGVSPAAEVAARPNGNLQAAPTFSEIAMVPVNLVSRGLGALTQSALCAGGVKTVVKYDQPVSAFEVAAFDRINQESTDYQILTEIKTRCVTARAHEEAVNQRYGNDRKYIRDLLVKVARNAAKDKEGDDAKRLQRYANDNYELLKTVFANKKQQENQQQDAIIAPRGLGVLPGTHAVQKCGYHYSLRPVLGGFFDSVADKFRIKKPLVCNIGTSYDLTKSTSAGKALMILNQGGTESCVAHAFSSALNFARLAQSLPNQTPARSFIWSWARQIGSSGHAFDGGAHKYLGNWGCSMNIAGDLVSTQGAPSEEGDYGCKWYSDMKAHVDADNTMTRYDSSALSAAAHGETDVASSLTFIPQSNTNTLQANVNAIKCAISGGYPVLIGIDVRRSSYYNDDVATSGHFVMPFSRTDMVDGVTFNNSIDYDHPVGGDDKNPIYGAGDFSVGGHAILLVGYDDDNQRFKFMNSWGTWWGDNGYGTLPYNYVCGTTGSYKAPAGLLTGHTTDTNGHNVDYAPFKSAPYAGYFGQIKSCTK